MPRKNVNARISPMDRVVLPAPEVGAARITPAAVMCTPVTRCGCPVLGLIGIAAAPDFTEDLIWAEFDESARRALQETGVHLEPSEYSDTPTPITLKLIEDGRRHLVLRGPLPIKVPVRLLHGMRDPDVPHRLAVTLAERIDGDDVQILLIKDGDHRLSTDRDLAVLRRTVEDLLSG